MRRTAVSIPSIIAEWACLFIIKERVITFLIFASGASTDLDTQFKVCLRVDSINQEERLFRTAKTHRRGKSNII